MPMVDEDSAKVTFPPPAIFLGCLFLGLAADSALGLESLDIPVKRAIGTIIAALGIALGGSGIIGFFRAGTNPEPWKRDAKLVTTGLYRFTRNPMYLGMTLALLGVAMFLGSLGALASVLLAVLLVDRFVIAKEEAHLSRTFGQDYEDYRQRVRRWI